MDNNLLKNKINSLHINVGNNLWKIIIFKIKKIVRSMALFYIPTKFFMSGLIGDVGFSGLLLYSSCYDLFSCFAKHWNGKRMRIKKTNNVLVLWKLFWLCKPPGGPRVPMGSGPHAMSTSTDKCAWSREPQQGDKLTRQHRHRQRHRICVWIPENLQYEKM